MSINNDEVESLSLFYAPNLAPLTGSGTENFKASETRQSVVLTEVETRLRSLLQDVCLNSDFPNKYDMTSPRNGEPYMYVLTTFNKPYKYSLEAFPRITQPSQDDLAKGAQTFRFHEVFESAIERYTEARTKPNPVLQETRSTDFCYPVTIHIEAVPHEKARKPFRLLLLREFQILITIWEQYRTELRNKRCAIDQLVGFPMPFEFCCVTGNDFDLPVKSFEVYNYYDTNGALVDITKSFKMPLSKNTTLNSTLSYMSVEKLGPSVTYLMELLKTQSKQFSLSSALMIYDQLLCRLFVMHKYGVVHGDLNTDCLRFGSGNACNVLYISDFSTSVVMPCKHNPLFLFHDRFVSTEKIKRKTPHFLDDLESAYYVFLLLAVGHLPWDSKLKWGSRISMALLAGQGTRDNNPVTDLPATTKDKEKFWDSASLLQRLVNSREFELEQPLYRNFIEDLMVTIFMKMKDIMSACSRHSQESFLRDINVFGTNASNAYLSLRKSIATYFRFETLNPFLKDPKADVKLGFLRSQDRVDRRVAWDLSFWCWNSINVDTKPNTPTSQLKTICKQTE